MPTLTEILAQINSEIVPNGNGHITANVLNPILVGMLEQINDLTGVLEDLTTDDVSSLVAAINSLSDSNEYYSLKIPLISSVEDGSDYLFPALNRGESRVVAVVNNKGVFNADGVFRLGGTSGVIAGHYTWIIALVNSVGGTFAEVGKDFLIINQKRPTVIYQADHFIDLPPTGNVYTIYWVLDTGNTYIWNNNDNQYELVGSVVEGTLIDEHTFEDLSNVVVAPDGSKVYFDTTDEIYYRWNGSVYLPINFSEGGGGGEADYSSLTDNVLPKKSSGTNALEDSNITDTATGVSVDGGVTLSNFGGTAVNGQLYRVGNSLRFKDGSGAVYFLNDEKMTISISPFDEDIEVMDCQPISFTFPFEIVDANIGVGTAPSGADIKVGIKKGATDVTPTTRITIPNGQINSVGATPPVFTSSSFAVGDIFKPYIAQVGSTTPGKDLHLTLTIRKL